VRWAYCACHGGSIARAHPLLKEVSMREDDGLEAELEGPAEGIDWNESGKQRREERGIGYHRVEPLLEIN
jgi:hypothetical protein